MKLLLTYLPNPAGPLIRTEADVKENGDAFLSDVTWGDIYARKVHVTSLPSWAQVALAQAIAGVKPIHHSIIVLEE